jgi:hypothetical protein
LNVHTGYDAWDDQGRFAFASFASEEASDVVLTRVDPERLKAALSNTHVTEQNTERSAVKVKPQHP